VLPTYNRAKFLPDAFRSIRAQTFGDWELIVVDDGSTDDTAKLVARLGADLGDRLRYVRRANGGPNAARTTGLKYATGDFVAFFDSDDYWLPHHLHDCVESLRANPDVDWVWGASKIEELESGRTVNANSFSTDRGAPLPFLKLRARLVDRLHVIEDPGLVRCAILGGLNCGLQGSVVRIQVAREGRFDHESRNIALDQLIVIRALKAGVRFAYFDDVHVLYRVHAENSSGAGGATHGRTLRALEEEAWCFEELLRDRAELTGAERRAARRRWSGICFWAIGYSLFWMHGRAAEAERWFRKGLCIWPWDWRLWKVYAVSQVRARCGCPPRLRQVQS
jgi:glycosyltransferase involved in cell wall biosynthesis